MIVDGVVSTFAGDGIAGYRDGPGATARFNHPTGVAVDASCNVFVCDSSNHRVRVITPGGVVTTLAGSGQAGFADGQGIAARFNLPMDIAVDSQGDVFIADYLNNRIRQITIAEGDVTTIAAGSDCQYSYGLAVDHEGQVFFTERTTNRIRKITTGGSVSTLAGGGTSGSVGGFQDGAAADARFNSPRGVAVDGDGNVFVADLRNNRIRQVTPDGTVTTIAGSGASGSIDGLGTAASFDFPSGIAIDPDGNIIVTDHLSDRIRKIIAGLPPPQGPPQPEVASSTYMEEMKSMLGDPTYSDVAFVVKHADDQAGGVLRIRSRPTLNVVLLLCASLSRMYGHSL